MSHSAKLVGVHSQSSNVSDEDLERQPLHMRQETSLDTKLQRIRDATSSKQLKVKDNNSLKDWWIWYWQHPLNRSLIVLFLVALLLVPGLSLFWFMDETTCFIVSGATVMVLALYAIRKFGNLIGLRHQVDKFKALNLKMKKDVLLLENEMNRLDKAHNELKTTKHRITAANDKNRDNLQRFEQISVNMKIAGQNQVAGMTHVYHNAQEMQSNWREQLLCNERDLLHSAYERFEKRGMRNDGVTHDEFRKLAKMLPKRYSKRFRRMGTFSTFAQGATVIDFAKFTNAIDLYATMEIDNVDLDPTPYATPSHTPQITPLIQASSLVPLEEQSRSRMNSFEMSVLSNQSEDMIIRYQEDLSNPNLLSPVQNAQESAHFIPKQLHLL